MDNTGASDPKARTIWLFSQIAGTYDQGGPAYFARFGQRLVERVGIAPGARVLDVATGRGAVLFPAAAAAGDSGSVIGIDLAEAMIEQTSAELIRHSIRNAEVYVGDAEQLGFEDASFDVVLCGFGVMFFPHLDRAMAEFRRVLAPGGTVGISTFKTRPPTPAIGPILRAYQGISHRTLTHELDTVDELHMLLNDAGFTHVTVDEETLDIVYKDADAYWSWSMGLLTGLWLRAQPQDIQTRFEVDVRAHLATIQQSDGIHESVTALIATGSH